jgi:hypothetical protein
MLFWAENDIFLCICLFWPTSKKKMFIFFSQSRSLAEPLATCCGTLGFRGTPVEKPWLKIWKSLLVTLKDRELGRILKLTIQAPLTTKLLTSALDVHLFLSITSLRMDDGWWGQWEQVAAGRLHRSLKSDQLGSVLKAPCRSSDTTVFLPLYCCNYGASLLYINIALCVTPNLLCSRTSQFLLLPYSRNF